jgi:hypothetical protein
MAPGAKLPHRGGDFGRSRFAAGAHGQTPAAPSVRVTAGRRLSGGEALRSKRGAKLQSSP